MSNSSKHQGPGQIPTPGKTPAEQRADYVRALNEEKASLESRGLSDRAKLVTAELARFDEKPAGRRKSGTDKA